MPDSTILQTQTNKICFQGLVQKHMAHVKTNV